jgi:hypothetical protein
MPHNVWLPQIVRHIGYGCEQEGEIKGWPMVMPDLMRNPGGLAELWIPAKNMPE